MFQLLQEFWMLTNFFESLFMHEMAPRIKFESFILFEPGVVPHADYPDYREVFKRYQAWVWLRREVWPSRKAAREELSGKAFFSGWDSESLDLFIVRCLAFSDMHCFLIKSQKHAIIDHPASQYPPPYTFTGVTYSTSKENETVCPRLFSSRNFDANIYARQAIGHLNLWETRFTDML